MQQQQHYAVMKSQLNERQWRLFLGTQAKQLGYGGISAVARLSGASWKTIKRGMVELENAEQLPKGQVRNAGGGRKKLTQSDPSLVADLEKLLETKGDPMTFLKYTTQSLAHLTEALREQGHHIKKSALALVLYELKYSLKPNKKNIEGNSHEDRDVQFQHINHQCEVFEQMGNPIISIDCKKKEQIGNFSPRRVAFGDKNNGKEWTGKGKTHERQVNAYDFRSLAEGLAIPYGIYDRLKQQGFVNVGIDHDTASFAVESIRRWWKGYGRTHYPAASGLLISRLGDRFQWRQEPLV